MSEAEFLIWSLDLRKDWAVIVCLVGGGQEINTGEAIRQQVDGGVCKFIALPMREDRRGVLLEAISRNRRQVDALCI